MKGRGGCQGARSSAGQTDFALCQSGAGGSSTARASPAVVEHCLPWSRKVQEMMG